MIERTAELILPLSTLDWQRILQRYGLPTDMADLWIIVRYARQGEVLFAGIYVAGAYRVLFPDTGQMETFDHVQGVWRLWDCCVRMAAFMGATLVQ